MCLAGVAVWMWYYPIITEKYLCVKQTNQQILSKSKKDEKIIVVQWIISTKHPSIYEMVRSSDGENSL